MPTPREVRHAENVIRSYMRWHERPAPRGADNTFLNPYLNWLSAYIVTMEALLNGEGLETSEGAWMDHLRVNRMHQESPGSGGAGKALRVWRTHVPASVHRWVRSEDPGCEEFVDRVMHGLRSYRARESHRLNEPRDYGPAESYLGTRGSSIRVRGAWSGQTNRHAGKDWRYRAGSPVQ